MMARNRTKLFSRKERKGHGTKDLITFSFKDLDESQPKKQPQGINSWNKDNLLLPFLKRLHDLSKLTRDEATKQKQIKIYGDFPINTDFHPPK